MKAGPPRVSVIVPAYNASGFLKRALHSALAQTMADLEVVVVDDASSDDTFKLACEIAARDPRVRVLQNEHNRGVYGAYNRAIDAARGEWVAALDSDDVWLPERLERMLSAADQADVVSDDLLVVRNLRINPSRSKALSFLSSHGLAVVAPRQLAIMEFVRHDLGLLKPLMRRSFLQKQGLRYNSDLRYMGDFLLYTELLITGARWLQLPSSYYLYYWHGGNLSSNTLGTALEAPRIIEALLRHPVVAADSRLIRALERREREWDSNRAFVVISDLLRQHRGAELARLLVQDPSHVPLAIEKVVRSLYRRVAWRIRSVSGQYSLARYYPVSRRQDAYAARPPRRS